ncbi:MAG: hypothetical protein EXR05_09160 [Acetobacteraceae bacterium]|nr:hypothetical protein [Acetobacteraceae bacterium]
MNSWRKCAGVGLPVAVGFSPPLGRKVGGYIGLRAGGGAMDLIVVEAAAVDILDLLLADTLG